jgi:hypothetical protein
MLDVFNIPGQQDNVKIFYAQSGSNSWQTWQKPRNCKFIWMMCIGGGAGGNGGASNTVAGSANGGGSGGVVRALFPANVLPDTLYIQPGLGGVGGSAGSGTGGDGAKSYVTITSSTASIMNIVCTSGAAAATGLNGETIATTANAGLLSLGNFIAIAGQSYAFAPVTPLTLTFVSAGANGGTSTASPPNEGGSILATNISPVILGGTSNTMVGGNGIVSLKPFYCLGGAGGWGSNSADAAAGTNGGNGAFGCGGGGGGSSTSSTGGKGGRGGDGLVIIATF